ncbi:hypothetical protein Tco_0726045, partial [Tanacetum coccineum]
KDLFETKAKGRSDGKAKEKILVLIPETTFVGVESRVLIPETTFVGVESRVLIPETTVWDTLVYPSDTLVILRAFAISPLGLRGSIRGYMKGYGEGGTSVFKSKELYAWKDEVLFVLVLMAAVNWCLIRSLVVEAVLGSDGGWEACKKEKLISQLEVTIVGGLTEILLIDKANKHILPKKPELNDDMYNWVIAKYGKPNTWIDFQFHSIANDVYTTFFEKAEPEIAQPEKVEAETVKPETAEPEKPDVPECSKKADVQECSNIKEKHDQQDVHPDTYVIEIGSSSSELECSSTSELECSSTSEKSPGLMKMTVSQKGPSKDLLNWYEDVNNQDDEEIDEDDDETDEQDDEIDEEAEDGKDDSDDEL